MVASDAAGNQAQCSFTVTLKSRRGRSKTTTLIIVISVIGGLIGLVGILFGLFKLKKCKKQRKYCFKKKTKRVHIVRESNVNFDSDARI